MCHVKTRKNVNRSQIEFPDACSMKPNFLVTYLLGFSTFVFNNTKGYIYMHEISLGYTQTSRRRAWHHVATTEAGIQDWRQNLAAHHLACCTGG